VTIEVDNASGADDIDDRRRYCTIYRGWGQQPGNVFPDEYSNCRIQCKAMAYILGARGVVVIDKR